jgi:hypothetical protein
LWRRWTRRMRRACAKEHQECQTSFSHPARPVQGRCCTFFPLISVHLALMAVYNVSEGPTLFYSSRRWQRRGRDSATGERHRRERRPQCHRRFAILQARAKDHHHLQPMWDLKLGVYAASCRGCRRRAGERGLQGVRSRFRFGARRVRCGCQAMLCT